MLWPNDLQLRHQAEYLPKPTLFCHMFPTFKSFKWMIHGFVDDLQPWEREVAGNDNFSQKTSVRSEGQAKLNRFITQLSL